MTKSISISKIWKRIKNWLSNEAKITQKNWYVWITPIAFIIGIIGLWVSIEGLQTDVQEIQKEIQNVRYDFVKVFNEQQLKTEDVSGAEVIEYYHDFLNTGDYQKACSLRSTQGCTLYDVGRFTKWVDNQKRYLTIKLSDGEKVEETWFSGEKLENTNAEIWCAKVIYKMNSEVDNIEKINQYSIATRPDQKKEIRRILCEGEVKRGVPTHNCSMTSQLCTNSKQNNYE